MEENKKPTWRVVRTIPENEDVTSLVIEAPQDVSDLQDKPGQFASIRVMGESGWSEPHPFTISCRPGDKQMQFTIKNVDQFTAAIRHLEPGTEIQCSGPLGVFCKDIGTKEHIVMIAGGVGITPFLSVLRSFRSQNADNEILLIWANKTLKDIFAKSELDEMARELNLRVVHVLSREKSPLPPSDKAISYTSGHVTHELIEEQVKSPTASFYLCGPPPMQDAVITALQSCGFSTDSIQKEAFGSRK